MNSELIQKEKDAIERLKAFEPIGDSYYLCYSGGKDSDAIRILAQLAGVRHEIHHNLTTVDAPETKDDESTERSRINEYRELANRT